MSKIRTYEDLLAEEKRLEAILYSHREAMKDSFAATKASLQPFKLALGTVNKLFTPSKTNPLMKFGLDFGFDVLFRRFILAKAGWFTKIVLPFIVKNYSTHFITERHKSKLFSKITGFFKEASHTVQNTIKEWSSDIKKTAKNVQEDVKDSTEDVQQSVSNTF